MATYGMLAHFTERGIMNVNDGRIGDQFVPVLDGQLAGHDGGRASMPVVENLQEIALLLGRERRQAPVVED